MSTMTCRNEFIRSAYDYPDYALRVQPNTASVPIVSVRVSYSHGYPAAGDSLDACCTDQFVNLGDSRPPGRFLENVQYEYKRRSEQERLAAERLAIVEAAHQAALEREQEPEPEEPAWDDLGGISDTQASLVLLDIGRPRRK